MIIMCHSNGPPHRMGGCVFAYDYHYPPNLSLLTQLENGVIHCLTL